jgi:2-isopropylmalate synthase
MRVHVYDTTLRDGTQGEHVALSLEDKLKIARRLDDTGFDYIEGGWPGSNPKDIRFFERVKKERLAHAKVAAFGSTRRANVKAAADTNLRLLVESEAPVVTIFGKTWDFHVTRALRIALEENLEMIRDSVEYLKSHGREVIYDAEHFFDGHKANPEYALKTLAAAAAGGADLLCLCDTNGGSLPDEIAAATRLVRKAIKGVPVGIHAHNDGGVGVANTLAAVRAGARHVQGTVNGYGERCGNADLCQVIANLELKMGHECIGEEHLHRLRGLSFFVSEVANLNPDDKQPFVGLSAFAHKGGIHVDAVMKDPDTYEHVKPEAVGNRRRVLVSELSGSSNIRYKASRIGIELKKGSPEVAGLLSEVKRLEDQGYEFEGAEASFELLLRRQLGEVAPLFDLNKLQVIVEMEKAHPEATSDAVLKLTVGANQVYVGAEGDGPVHAMDNALRKALNEHYPQLKDLHLTDFKVRVVNTQDGTAAKVRVLLESSCNGRSWTTVGVSTNIIEASWVALIDGIAYGLLHYDAFMRNGN